MLQLLAAPQDVETVLLHPVTGLLRDLQLYLCAGDRVVAVASVPLAKLVSLVCDEQITKNRYSHIYFSWRVFTARGNNVY